MSKNCFSSILVHLYDFNTAHEAYDYASVFEDLTKKSVFVRLRSFNSREIYSVYLAVDSSVCHF